MISSTCLWICGVDAQLGTHSLISASPFRAQHFMLISMEECGQKCAQRKSAIFRMGESGAEKFIAYFKDTSIMKEDDDDVKPVVIENPSLKSE